MFHVEEIHIPVGGIEALAWDGDSLVDCANGGHRYHLDGRANASRGIYYGNLFDKAIRSPSGDYVLIYTCFGTKGLILHRGKLIREVNRSYYCADAYEYPAALFRLRDGREVIAHCPDEYCRLEIDDLATGECLTSALARKPKDFFHSRLQASPDGAYLLSAGWVWHPIDVVEVFDVERALSDPTVLDGAGVVSDACAEQSSAAFSPEGRLIVYLNDIWSDDDSTKTGFGEFRIYDCLDGSAPRVTPSSAIAGTIMPLGEDHVLGFYGHPKIFDLATGAVIQEWPHIQSGKQTGSVDHGEDGSLPPIACDAQGLRVAIAGKDGVFVLLFKRV